MDKVFANLIENFGPPIDRREVPGSTIEKYRDKLPSTLLEYWSEHGWGGYGEGIFWLVNPQEYDAVVSCWIAGTALASHDNYHLVARSAFGDLYLWGEKTGFSLEITSVGSQYIFYRTEFTKEQLNTELQGFILSREVESMDFNGLFNPAKEKLGKLNMTRCTAFFPHPCWAGLSPCNILKKSALLNT